MRETAIRVSVPLVVDPGDLLVARRDHARLARRAPAGIDHEPRRPDPLRAQRFPQPPALRIVTDDPDDLDRRAQRPEVRSHVGGTAETVLLAGESDDGHGCFGRDAVDRPDHEMIEHHIADDDDRLRGEAAEQL
jgi:hypothetical protein